MITRANIRSVLQSAIRATIKKNGPESIKTLTAFQPPKPDPEDEIVEVLALGMVNNTRLLRAYHPVEELAKLKSADVWRKDARAGYRALRERGYKIVKE